MIIKAQKVKQKQKKHTMKQMSIKSRLLRGFKGKKGISFPETKNKFFFDEIFKKAPSFKAVSLLYRIIFL